MAAVVAGFSMCVAPFVSAAPRLPNDQFFPEQWYLEHIGVLEAWNTSLGFEGVSVAVIDSGVDTQHPDLRDNIWRNEKEVPGDGIDNDRNGYIDDVVGWDFVDQDADPRPSIDGSYSVLGANHGTISAGIIAARGDNNEGMTGITWQTHIMALRALSSDGTGDPDDIVRAVDYAVANGASVINLSFAGETANENLKNALRRAYDRGVFVVAAAGNAPDGTNATDLDHDPRYPVCLDQDDAENFIYGVAATDENDLRAPFSNFGAGCVDISAPGTHVIATQFFDSNSKDFLAPYGGYYNGTSVAAPIVSGSVALIKALDRNLTPKQIQNALTATAFRLEELNTEYFGRLGRGRIDVAKAVAHVSESLRPVATPLATTMLLPSGTSRIVVAAPGEGRDAEVRMYTEDGLYVRSFAAFPKGFRGGASLAIGNFDGIGRQSIVTGAGPGGTPQVRVFDINTRPIGGFFAYDGAFGGGVDVAVGDLDGDGKDEIVTGAGPGGGPHVRVFTPKGVPIAGFFAFDEDERGGVDVTVGDLDGDGKDEIIAVRGDGTGEVRTFSATGVLLGTIADPAGRVVIAVTDADGDGKDEVVLHDRVKATATDAMRADVPAGSPPLLSLVRSDRRTISFYVYETGFLGGVSTGILEVKR